MSVSRRSVGVPLAVFLIAGIAYTALGLTVAHAPPTGVDAAARTVAGEAPALAWIFTESCLWPALTTLGVIGCVLAARFPAWRGRIVFAIVSTLVTWLSSNVLKDLFQRPRPAYWVLHHETTFAYSSGHAMFATLVYWLWAYHVSQSDLPAGFRTTVAALLATWGAGVIWSRLALGAHYPSDLAGGVLLAVAMVGLALMFAALIAPHARVL